MQGGTGQAEDNGGSEMSVRAWPEWNGHVWRRRKDGRLFVQRRGDTGRFEQTCVLEHLDGLCGDPDCAIFIAPRDDREWWERHIWGLGFTVLMGQVALSLALHLGIGPLLSILIEAYVMRRFITGFTGGI